MNDSPWLMLASGMGDAAWNMAMDEALLEAMPRLNLPVLRFYEWSAPAASFGFFQKYSEIETLTPLRPLVRRPTGGGLVPHARDWTYSLAVPPTSEWYRLRALDSYARMHEWLRHTFLRLGFSTVLAPVSRKDIAGQCFVGHEQSDLLWHERKIAGAAQRRRRDGLLIQGSVQPPPGALERAIWEQAMLAVGAEQLAILWSKMPPDAELSERADYLAQTKYANASYNRRK